MPPTRRQFIKHAATAGIALAVSRPSFAIGRTSEIDPVDIKSLGSHLKGQLLLPGDSSYDIARRVFRRNSTTDKRPALIARCTCTEDIQRCIEFAHQQNILVAVRSGGHSPLAWSICEGGLVIDVSPLKGTSIDHSERTVRAGAGLTAKELVLAASQHGLAPVLGECPTVGISGLTLGGGLGWLSGGYGAACDNLLSAQLITASGDLVVTSPTDNPDLFWAIRGGGGNFGIATLLEYRLHPLKEVFAGGIKYRFSDARKVLRFYADFMANAPDQLQALAYLPGVDERSLNLIICYSGGPKDAEKAVRPLRQFAPPILDTLAVRPFPETFTMPLNHEGIPRAFSAAKNCSVGRLSDELVDIVIDRYASAPHRGCSIGLDHYMHGAVCRVSRDSTAFEFRDASVLHVWNISDWNDPGIANASMEWVNTTWQALQPFSGGRVYANYLSVEGEQAVKGAFGANYPRLRTIKAKYDPKNFFSLNPNIRPAAC